MRGDGSSSSSSKYMEKIPSSGLEICIYYLNARCRWIVFSNLDWDSSRVVS